MHHTESIFPQRNRYMMGAIAVGVVGLVLSIIGAIFDLEGFFQSYLVAYLYWVGVTVGCFSLMMLMNLLDGALSFSTQRFFAAGARTLPIMALLFVPIAVGVGYLYPWTSPSIAEALPAAKASYYTIAFFLLRAAIYFVLWIALAYIISQWSYQNDKEKSQGLKDRIGRLSVAGILLFFVTGTFAAIDWNMSLDPKWFSSLYGLVYITREGLAAMALAVLMLGLVWNRLPLTPSIRTKALSDLGSVLLASIMVWAYMEFFQFLIIWQGNVPGKAAWYVARSGGAWSVYIGIVVFLHFFVPLLLLLMPGFKDSIKRLMIVAGLLLVMRLFELIWAVLPAYSPELSLSWLNFVLPVALGGIWVAAYLWLLKDHRLLPAIHTEWQQEVAAQK